MTKKLVVKDGLVIIEFELYQDSELVNKTKINIKYTFIKEE